MSGEFDESEPTDFLYISSVDQVIKKESVDESTGFSGSHWQQQHLKAFAGPVPWRS